MSVLKIVTFVRLVPRYSGCSWQNLVTIYIVDNLCAPSSLGSWMSHFGKLVMPKYWRELRSFVGSLRKSSFETRQSAGLDFHEDKRQGAWLQCRSHLRYRQNGSIFKVLLILFYSVPGEVNRFPLAGMGFPSYSGQCNRDRSLMLFCPWAPIWPWAFTWVWPWIPSWPWALALVWPRTLVLPSHLSLVRVRTPLTRISLVRTWILVLVLLESSSWTLCALG